MSLKRRSENDAEASKYHKRSRAKLGSVFNVVPLSLFFKQFPYYRQPKEIGRFSLDASRNFKDDDSQLKNFCGPLENRVLKEARVGEMVSLPLSRKVTHNLRVGYSNYVCKNEETSERLDHLLQWIKKHESRFSIDENRSTGRSSSLNTDFISWRGHFTKFLCTPYETREPWQMAACKFRDSIFISEVLTEFKKEQERNRSEHQKEMCYWGYKFEDFMTNTNIQETESEETVINSNEAFCTVIRTRLGQHSLVIGAEVDCQLKNSASPPENYVELKTSREITSERQASSFSRFKLRKFWAQSFLAGIPNVVCGFRDDDGVVNEIRTYKTLEIPKIAREKGSTWDASVCMNFCNDLLHWIKTIVIKEDPNVVYMFYFREPFEYIECLVTNDGSDRFLPAWFTHLEN